MRAFVAGVVAAIVIAAAAGFALDALEMSSAKVYSTSSVRLGE